MTLKDVGSGLNVLDQGDVDAKSEPNGIDQGDGAVGSGLNDLNQGLGDDNRFNMLDEGDGNVFHGLNFSWIDRIIDEDNYETDVENNESEWVDRERLVSDDDDDEMENTDLAIEGQGSGEDTEYLDSSDVGSFEIDLDGDSVCKKSGSLKGEILAAVGRDSNDQIFPIAWAVVEVENRDTWAWFLKNTHADLNLGDGGKFTLISDMQKGLLEEVPLCLPNVEHRFCARHMYSNWKKVRKCGDLQLLFWSCCKATTQPQFNRYASRIGELKPKALDDLMLKDPKYWSKAFFSTRSKCDAIDNNFSEAFNYAIIEARFKSVISLFEDIRHYVMNRLVEHKRKSLSWKCVLCPGIEKKLEQNKVSSAFCHVTWNGDEGYEVMCHQDTFVVDVRGWSCTCRMWNLTGIPCQHAVCVILYREESLETYVSDAYKKHVYHELYNVDMPTIPSENFWKDAHMGSIDPPLKRKLPGRPKHKRKREECEVHGRSKLGKKGLKISCRQCGLVGHNIRTCPNKKQTSVEYQAVQTHSSPPMSTHTEPIATPPISTPTGARSALVFNNLIEGVGSVIEKSRRLLDAGCATVWIDCIQFDKAMIGIVDSIEVRWAKLNTDGAHHVSSCVTPCGGVSSASWTPIEVRVGEVE
ncbi:hypothetical protein GQ457_14G002440 [Hibiscus cannabinus]